LSGNSAQSAGELRAKVTAALAAALGNTADEAYFKTMFENIKKDYNAKWFDTSVGYYRETANQPFL